MMDNFPQNGPTQVLMQTKIARLSCSSNEVMVVLLLIFSQIR
jgi:hypothetical protein